MEERVFRVMSSTYEPVKVGPNAQYLVLRGSLLGRDYLNYKPVQQEQCRRAQRPSAVSTHPLPKKVDVDCVRCSAVVGQLIKKPHL